MGKGDKASRTDLQVAKEILPMRFMAMPKIKIESFHDQIGQSKANKGSGYQLG